MRFAEFDVDERAGVLLRHGARVRLQDLPVRLLVLLLRRPGVVISRDELRAALWGSETFVDAEAGLNTAIAKIREALGDDADTPRFIETIPKRGYRFIGTIETAPATVDNGAPQAAQVSAHRRLWLVGIGAVATLVAAFTVHQALVPPDRVTIAVVRFHNETGIAEHDRLAGALTDAVVVSLAANPAYAVIGNSPLLTTTRIFQDVRKIGEALDADYVVLGQLQSSDRGLVARAHFIRTSDERHLWAATIDLAGVADTERLVIDTVSGGVATGLTR
jgi:DNA-binding winged helix-turn-helix (wHTH) protein/TolB-like protein